MSMFVKKGDTVLIIAGKDNGKTGKVTSCDPKSGRVVVEGCNIITKHTKPRGVNQPGGINKVAGPIDASNVQVICPSCGKATRVGHKIEGDTKIRVCKHKDCGASLEPKKAEKKTKKAAKADKNEAAAEETKKAPAKKAKKTTKPAEGEN